MQTHRQAQGNTRREEQKEWGETSTNVRAKSFSASLSRARTGTLCLSLLGSQTLENTREREREDERRERRKEGRRGQGSGTRKKGEGDEMNAVGETRFASSSPLIVCPRCCHLPLIPSLLPPPPLCLLLFAFHCRGQDTRARRSCSRVSPLSLSLTFRHLSCVFLCPYTALIPLTTSPRIPGPCLTRLSVHPRLSW